MDEIIWYGGIQTNVAVIDLKLKLFMEAKVAIASIEEPPPPP